MQTFNNYEELRVSCVIGDILVCLSSDTVAWQIGKKYDIIRFDVDSIVVSRQHFCEAQWLWPWGQNPNIKFGKIKHQG